MKILLLSLLLLTGCAGAGFGGQNGQPFVGLEPLNENKGQIYIYRPYKKFWLKAYPNVSVDGEVVGELRNGTYLVVDLPPQKYNFTILKNEYWTIPDMLAEVEVKAGERQFFSVAASWEDMDVGMYGVIAIMSFSASAKLVQIKEEFATKEISNLLKHSNEGS